MKIFPALYGTSKTDKTKKWLISVKMNPDKTATIITENGYIDGKMNVSNRIIKTGKNIGKVMKQLFKNRRSKKLKRNTKIKLRRKDILRIRTILR